MRPMTSQVLPVEETKPNRKLLPRLMPFIILFVIVFLIFGIIYFYYFMPRAIGKLQIEKFIISSKRHAYISQIYVKYGSEVEAGQIVVKLDTNELIGRKQKAIAGIKVAEKKIPATKASLQLKQDELKLKLDDNLIFRAIDMETARANLKEDTATYESAIEKLKGAEIELKRRLSLLKKDAIAQAKVDEIQTRYNALQKEIDNFAKVIKADETRFESALKRYQEYNQKDINVPIEEIMKPVIQEIAVNKAELDIVNAMIENSILKAPTGGHVIGKHKNQGEAVDVAEPIITIINGPQDLVQSYVRERWMTSVEKGRKVKVVPVAGTQVLYGEIIFVAEGISRIPQEYLEPYEQQMVNGLRFIIKLDQPCKGPLGSTFEVFFR